MNLSLLQGVKILKNHKIQFLNKNSDFVHSVDLEKGLKLYNDILFGEFYCLLRSKNGWCIYLDCIWWQAWRWTLFEVCSEILVYMLKHQIKWHLPFTSLPMANVQESIERNVKNGLIERTIHPLRPPLFRSSPKRWPSNSMMMIFCVFGISTC